MGKSKILIIGKKGFIGSSLANFLPNMGYEVIQLSGRLKEWKSFDMAGVDTVVYAAGLAHCKERKNNRALFVSANVLQAEESALRAKEAGVKQYIYISSMNVYGSTGKRIGKNTPVKPDRLYGRSKRQGELKILNLEDDKFAVVIIRPPVVTGAGCKGSIRSLTKVSRYIKFFPDYPNQRSILDIRNLCEFISCMQQENASGIYHPQNEEYISTYQLLSLMADAKGKKIYPIRFLNPIITRMLPKSPIVRKVFGDDCYEKELSTYPDISYCIRSNKESVGDMVLELLK